ncbi:MAG: L-serine ammonia-lyase, iron-sulfur-dependent, subunit alpha [Clostridia bacterium]|nr:L-serine ammonia-lyase, iron-sulfur-dependent, subunit alpha [Clostridia bacterium]
MESIQELFKIGNGPSSSHTIGPKKAVEYFLNNGKNYDFIRVTLYGSLALTGKGHLTDHIIHEVLDSYRHEVVFDKHTATEHPNTLICEGFKNNALIQRTMFISIGGGSIRVQGEAPVVPQTVYPHNTFGEIKDYCLSNDISLSEYVFRFEGEKIRIYLKKVYETMMAAINRGLNAEGVLPGVLKIERKAKRMYNASKTIQNRMCSYAYAVSEENACGGVIVTAPTCGASGVLPAVIKYTIEKLDPPVDKIIEGLAVAGIIGNVVKTNASISGAEAGCQAEVGTACAMAAAFYTYVNDFSIPHIEQATEVALEHHLGMTCDPIMGYIQIPCIERNAVAAMRAVDAFILATLLDPKDQKITLDMICATMLETGKDLTSVYRETSQGGLAKYYKVEE